MKKKEKNLLINNIPKELKEDVMEFCELNDIKEIDSLLLGCLKGGFAIEKYGITPVKPGVIEKEVEKEVEKIVEVPTIVEQTDDDLEFGEMFNKERERLGANQIFLWRNKYYSTNYEEE